MNEIAVSKIYNLAGVKMNNHHDFRYGAPDIGDYPDHSNYIWHLTANRLPLNRRSQFGNTGRNVNNLCAFNRLINIIRERTIWESHLHYMDPNFHNLNNAVRCVCFTECIPNSLPIHAERFSNYGLIFTRETAYRIGVRPAWYMDPILLNRLSGCQYDWQRNHEPLIADFPEEYLHLLIPYAPEYGNYRFGRYRDMLLDFSVEREWRIGNDFVFELEDISAIIVPDMQGMERVIDAFPDVEEHHFFHVDRIVQEDASINDFEYFYYSRAV